MKVEISRSFSKKIQLKQFEPIDSFCGIKIEYENGLGNYTLDTLASGITAEKYAGVLDKFCRDEVEKTLAIIRPSLKAERGKSKAEKKDEARTSAEFDAGQIEEA